MSMGGGGGMRKKGYTDELYDRGQEMYDKATGRTMYDKATGRGILDKAADFKDDLLYGRRQPVKDTGYHIGDKLSNMAQSVKDTFVGHGGDRGYGREDSYISGGRGGGGLSNIMPGSGGVGSSWFGGDNQYMSRGRDEEDEYGLATDKLKKVVRTAEREM